MNQEHVMEQLLRRVFANTHKEELRSSANGSLCLHMLAAKLSEAHTLAINPTMWEMDQNGNVTVTLSARDAKRYGMTTCTVTRDQFEDLVLQVFYRKITIAPFTQIAWNGFRARLTRQSIPTMVPRGGVGTNVGKSGGSSLNYF